MPRPVAALDADVLVPILSCDLLLTTFETGLYEPVVSTEVIVEVERNLLEDFPKLDPARVRRRVRQMAHALEDFVVDPDPDANVPVEINPKDRHVIAAASSGEATIVVTNDKRFRAETTKADIGLEPMDADSFALLLLTRDPASFERAVEVLAAKRTRHRVTPARLMESLERAFPRTGRAWRLAH
jgi:predicted nucleic acid-binding protein